MYNLGLVLECVFEPVNLRKGDTDKFSFELFHTAVLNMLWYWNLFGEFIS